MNDLKIFINENARTITVFVTALILIGGISLVNNVQNWWVLPLGVLFFGVVTLLFINAKSFIKFFISLFATVMISAYAFQFGLAVSGDNAGSFWMGLIWFNFFAFISVSYAKESNQSRWTSIIITQILSFLYFYVAISGLDFRLGLIIGEVITVLTFIAFYYFPFKNLVNSKNIPKQEISQTFINKVEKETKRIGWDYKVLPKNNTILIWGKSNKVETSLVLIPVELEQQLGLIGTRRRQLSYKGKAINPWLSKLLTNTLPYWKLRGITPLPVLCDIHAKNGTTAKIIGVKIPDKKNPYPFIITPAKTNFIEKIIKEYGDILLPLNEKQIKAVEELGVK